MASAAGLPCKVDPTLVAALRSQKNGNRITVLSSIRVAQAIHVRHFISGVNGIFMNKIFVEVIYSILYPNLLSSPLSNSVSTSEDCTVYTSVPMLFAVIRYLLRTFT
jgi:hypothetical protein